MPVTGPWRSAATRIVPHSILHSEGLREQTACPRSYKSGSPQAYTSMHVGRADIDPRPPDSATIPDIWYARVALEGEPMRPALQTSDPYARERTS